MTRTIKIVSAGLGLMLLGKNVIDKYTKDFWHYVKYKIESVDVNFMGGTSFEIDLSFLIMNNYKLGVSLSNVIATAYYPNSKGDLVEFASMPKSDANWNILANATTRIKNVKINASGWQGVGAAKAYFTLPEGKRMKIIVTGKLNNIIPFSTEIWY